jgi:hypothetical protein
MDKKLNLLNFDDLAFLKLSIGKEASEDKVNRMIIDL